MDTKPQKFPPGGLILCYYQIHINQTISKANFGQLVDSAFFRADSAITQLVESAWHACLTGKSGINLLRKSSVKNENRAAGAKKKGGIYMNLRLC